MKKLNNYLRYKISRNQHKEKSNLRDIKIIRNVSYEGKTPAETTQHIRFSLDFKANVKKEKRKTKQGFNMQLIFLTDT